MIGGLLKTTSALAILAAAGLIVGSVTLAPKAARAADLGGDCCADLEERVAELEATTARKGNRKMSLTISGRVNANILYWNENGAPPVNTVANGAFDHASDFYFGNSAGTESNFKLNGSGKISSDVTAGFYMEVRVDPSVGVAQTQNSHQQGPGFSGRQQYVYLSSKSLGELRLGRLTGAFDDAPYGNFGGGTIGGLGTTPGGGSFNLRFANGAYSGQTYGGVLGEIFDNQENRIKYISPTLGGFTFKADVGGDDTAGANLGWAQKFGTVNVEAIAAYKSSKRIDGVIDQVFFPNLDPLTNVANDNLRSAAISASIWETNSGLYLSGEYAKGYSAITGRNDTTNWFVQGGWMKNVTGVGVTTIYASYFKAQDMLTNDTSAHYFNVGVDQELSSVASNVYLHYQRDTFDGCTNGPAASCTLSNGALAVGIPSQSLDTVTGGMVVHF